ncbi:MAG: hypothetical protein ABIU05_07615 [Nitrospirales bacterium]
MSHRPHACHELHDVEVAQGIAHVDFGFIEPTLLAAVAKTAKDGQAAPKTLDGHLITCLAIDLRGNRAESTHRPFLVSRVSFSNPFKDCIYRSLLPIPPAPALIDQLMIDVHTIGQDHIGQCSLVFVLVVSLEDDIFLED